MATQAPPDHWSEDSLTEYLQAYRSNQFATFANKGQSMKDLIQIDALFQRLQGAVNPRPLYPMNFMLRAHSAYRAGVGAIMGGQLYESKAVLRLCLEHAAYGFYIGSNSDRMKRWLCRGDSDANRNAVRKEFQISKIKAEIRNHAPKLSRHFDYLYNQLIDLGAHPNEQGYSLNSTIIKIDGDSHIKTIYLQEDGAPLDFSIKIAAQVGLWSLFIMQLLYPERYELLGIREKLEELRNRF